MGDNHMDSTLIPPSLYYKYRTITLWIQHTTRQDKKIQDKAMAMQDARQEQEKTSQGKAKRQVILTHAVLVLIV